MAAARIVATRSAPGAGRPAPGTAPAGGGDPGSAGAGTPGLPDAPAGASGTAMPRRRDARRLPGGTPGVRFGGVPDDREREAARGGERAVRGVPRPAGAG